MTLPRTAVRTFGARCVPYVFMISKNQAAAADQRKNSSRLPSGLGASQSVYFWPGTRTVIGLNGRIVIGPLLFHRTAKNIPPAKIYHNRFRLSSKYVRVAHCGIGKNREKLETKKPVNTKYYRLLNILPLVTTWLTIQFSNRFLFDLMRLASL